MTGQGFRFTRVMALLLVMIMAPALAGCSMFGRDEYLDYVEPEPAPKLYDEAVLAYNAGRYTLAAEKFTIVDREHPYSPYARRAGLMLAASYYRGGDFDSAILAARRYLTLNPASQEAPYAQYIIAQSYYNQMGRVDRDQKATRDALFELAELVRLYPESEYVEDARLKIVITRDQLAGKEMEVGRYYLQRRNFLASINRFKGVVENYQDTSHIEEALYRLTESYMALGVVNEAQTAAAVLGFNYPDSQWYQRAFTLLRNDGLSPEENRGSWLSRAFRSVTG